MAGVDLARAVMGSAEACLVMVEEAVMAAGSEKLYRG